MLAFRGSCHVLGGCGVLAVRHVRGSCPASGSCRVRGSGAVLGAGVRAALALARIRAAALALSLSWAFGRSRRSPGAGRVLAGAFWRRRRAGAPGGGGRGLAGRWIVSSRFHHFTDWGRDDVCPTSRCARICRASLDRTAGGGCPHVGYCAVVGLQVLATYLG